MFHSGGGEEGVNHILITHHILKELCTMGAWYTLVTTVDLDDDQYIKNPLGFLFVFVTGISEVSSGVQVPSKERTIFGTRHPKPRRGKGVQGGEGVRLLPTPQKGGGNGLLRDGQQASVCFFSCFFCFVILKSIASFQSSLKFSFVTSFSCLWSVVKANLDRRCVCCVVQINVEINPWSIQGERRRE